MSTHKHIDRICCAVLALVLALTVLFIKAEQFGVQAVIKELGYEAKLFDTRTVHTIDIVMDNWDDFIDTCENEEYEVCSLVIDKEAYKNVGIRAKGNTSLSMVSSYGNDRYSFKIEFDHYDSTKSYYGLDKLSLNNIIQDNTFMKDYLTYQMMGYFSVDAPLCSYVYITVNGEGWGLYLAVEGVEEAFLERNYGSDYGELYKPDSMSMGGGRGNGGQFDMEEFEQKKDSEINAATEDDGQPDGNMPQWNGEQPDGSMPKGNGDRLDGGMPPERGGNQDGRTMPENGEMPEGGMTPGNGAAIPGDAGGGMVMDSDDVSLIYSDDEYSSYSNIFENAKTEISDTDKERLISALKELNEGTNIEETVNVEEVIRYFVVHNFVCNFDSYTGSMIHNYYLYEKDGQLSMIPWDYNLAFGGFGSMSDAASLVNYPIDTPVSGKTADSRPMLAWIFQSEEYTELYHQYFAEFISSYFDSGYFEKMMETVSEMIAPYVEKDPTKFCTYEEFEKGVSTLREFCVLRAESVSGQIAGTIPSTSEAQIEDSAELIDASGITISDMGTMGDMRGKK
jgi:spore coat protein CotH